MNVKTLLTEKFCIHQYFQQILLGMVLFLLTVVSAQAQTVTSDKEDYAPGEIAVITGTGWLQDSLVDIHLEENPEHEHHHGYHDTKVNADGTWRIEYPIEERHLGVAFTVIVVGKQSGVEARAYFTDANNTNLAVTSPATGTYGGTVTLSARLTQQGGGGSGVGNGNPIPNVPLAFSLNGASVGSATTNSDGIATLTTPIPTTINAATYNNGVTASFAGNTTYNSKSGTGQLVVNRILTAVTVSPVAGLYGGNVTLQANLKADGSNFSNKTITFKLNGNTVGTATTNNGGNASLNTNLGTIAEGTYAGGVSAEFAGETNYTASSNVASLTVNPNCTAPSISTQPITNSIVYGGNATFAVAATGTASLGYQWQVNSGTGFTNINGATLATLSLTNPTVSMSGYQYRCVVTNGCGTATSNAATLTVNKATATVTLGNLQHTYDGTAKSATATTDAAGTSNFTFTYDGSSHIPVNHKEGGYAVVATLVNDNYSGSATGTLFINKANQVISWTAPSDITYGTALSGSQLNATALGGATLVYSPAEGTVLNAGEHTLSVSAAETNNYNAATKTVSLKVNKATASLSLGNLTHSYDGEDKLATATTVPAGLSGVSISNNGKTDAGTYEVIATLDNANYEAVAVKGNLVISKAAVTLTLSNLNHTYDGTEKSATATATPNVAGVSVTGSGTNAGEYAVSASLNNPNYEAESVSGTLVIAKAALTIKADDASKVYGDENPAFTGSVVSGAVQGESFSVTASSAATANSNVGEYDINPSVTGATLANYNVTANKGTLTVTKRLITVTANAGQTKVYGEANPAAYTYELTSGSLVNNAHLTGALSRAAGENVGTYAISQGTLAATSNYDLTFAGADFTITKRNVEVTADSKSKVYGNQDPALTYAVTTGSLVEGDSFAGALSRAAGENVGTYIVGLGTLSLGNNYSLSLNEGSVLTITPKAASVTPMAKSKVYGADDPELSGETSGFLAADDITATYSRVAGETVAGGPYTISATLSPAAALDNYDVTYNTAAFTITKASLTATADNKNRKYGQDNPALTLSYSGFVKNEDESVLAKSPVLSTTATKSSGVGTYPIAVTGGEAANYTFTLVNGTLNINKADIAVVADNKSKVYGDANPGFTGTITGIVNDDDIEATYSSAATALSSVGEYDIVPSLAGDALANYNAPEITKGKLTITQRAITITADNKEKYCGQVDPVLTHQITSGNLVGTDNVSGALTRVSGESAGSLYAISQGTVAINSNYSITYVPANLTISGVSIDASASGNPVATGTSALLSASVIPAVAGISVTFKLDGVVKGSAVTDGSGKATYTVSGLAVNVYQVEAIAGSGCSSSTAYLPVYDPNGGFVTGGGWINSPAGALISDPTATGKANFGFVAKYKKGSTALEGETEFQFQAGDLKFKSTSYETATLVISGAKASYRGIGTINGAGSYKFTLTAVDGQVTGGGGTDKVRMKITNTDGRIVYDNQIQSADNADLTTSGTLLGGGSIVIHDASVKGGSNTSKLAAVAPEESTTRFYNYPNAFSDRTTISFTLDKEESFALEVYDLKGALVRRVKTGTAEANKLYEFEVDGRSMAEGIYIARLTTGSRSQSIKMILKK